MVDTGSKNIKGGAILTYITQFLSIAISFVYVPIMLGKLGQSEYGLYAIVQSLISYLQMSEMGIGTTATRYNAKYIADGDKEGQRTINGMFFKIYIGIAAVCALLGMVLYFFLDKIYYDYSAGSVALIKKLFIIAIINLVIVLFSHIFNAIIVAYEKFIFLKLITLVQTILGPVGMLTVLYLGAGSVGMLWVTTGLSLLFGLTQAIYCIKKFGIRFSLKAHDSTLFKKIFSFTLFVFLNTLANQLILNSDKIIISVIMTEVAVAVYAIVVQFHTYSYNFSNVLSGFYLPKYTKAITQAGKFTEELFDDLIRTGRLQVIVAGLIFGGFLAIGDPFILLWVGPEYSEAYWLTVIVLITEMFGAAQSMFNALMHAMNLHKMRAILTLVGAIIKVILTVAMTMWMGLLGCAIAFTVSWFSRMVIYNVYYKRRVGIDVKRFWLKMCGIFIPLLLTIGALYAGTFFALKLLPATNYKIILLYVVVYCILYLGALWLFVLNKYEKSVFSSLLQKALSIPRKIFKRS